MLSAAAGLLLATGALLFWASNGMPYQDATADMLQAQQQRALQLEHLMLLGGAIASAGSYYLWRGWQSHTG